MIEMHQTDRVRLQFGFPQYQPTTAPRDMRGFHKITMHTVTKAVLSIKFQDEIATWHQRRQLVIPGVPWNTEVKPDSDYITWYWGYFGNNLVVSRRSVLGDPRTRLLAPPLGLVYPPTPQHHTPPQAPNHPATPQFHQPTPQPSYHPFDNTQSDHTYQTPQPDYHTQQSNYPNIHNTYHYQSTTYPTFQNSPVTYGDYDESSEHSSSQHMSTYQSQSSSTYAESSHQSYETFQLPPAYLQSFLEQPSQPSQHPPTQTSQNYTQMIDELMATPFQMEFPSPVANEAMNSLWAGTIPEETQEVQQQLRRSEREIFPAGCGTGGHRVMEHGRGQGRGQGRGRGRGRREHGREQGRRGH